MKIGLSRVPKAVFLISWVMLIYFFIFNLIDKGTSVRNSYLFIMMIVISTIVQLVNNKHLSSRVELKILLISALYLVWICFASCIARYGHMAFSNIIQYALFLAYILSTAKAISELKCLKNVVYVSSVEIALILIVRLYRYKDFIVGIDLFSALRRSINSIRITFGFQNVNVCGNLCMLELCLLTICFFSASKIKKYHTRHCLQLMIFSAAIIVAVVMAFTGTRTAFLCFLIYVAIIIAFLYLSRKKKMVRQLVIMECVLAISGFILSYFMIETSPLKTIEVLTGRRNAVNLRLLDSVSSLLLGIGFINPGEFGANNLHGVNTTWMDNYYLYILVTGGIIGFLINMWLIVFIAKKLIHRFSEDKSITNFCFLMTYMIFFIYGFFETSVIFPKFTSCVVFLPMAFSYVFDNKLDIS